MKPDMIELEISEEQFANLILSATELPEEIFGVVLLDKVDEEVYLINNEWTFELALVACRIFEHQGEDAYVITRHDDLVTVADSEDTLVAKTSLKSYL